jgi:hypothetical protein
MDYAIQDRNSCHSEHNYLFFFSVPTYTEHSKLLKICQVLCSCKFVLEIQWPLPGAQCHILKYSGHCQVYSVIYWNTVTTVRCTVSPVDNSLFRVHSCFWETSVKAHRISLPWLAYRIFQNLWFRAFCNRRFRLYLTGMFLKWERVGLS